MITPLPRAAILDLFRQLSDIEAAIWEGESVPFADTYIVMDDDSTVQVGTDEVRRAYNSSKQINVETVVGQRSFTLQFAVVDLTGQTFPQDVVETVRVRLRRESSVTSLSAMGLSIINMVSIGDTSTKNDTRKAKRANLDIMCNRVVSEVDEQQDGGWIETVNTNNEVPGTITP